MQPTTNQLERDIERTRRLLDGVTDPLSVRTLRAYVAELEARLETTRQADQRRHRPQAA